MTTAAMSGQAGSRGPRRSAGDVPGPDLGRLRTLQLLRADAPAALSGLQRQYGPITRLRVPVLGTIYVVSDPAVVQEVLTLSGRAFEKGVVRRGQDPAQPGPTPLTALLGQGLLTSSGDLHKHQRRLLQPLFHRDRIAGYATAFADLTAEATRRWRDGETRPLHRDMTDLTLAIIARTVFDVSLGDGVMQVVRRAVDGGNQRGIQFRPALFDRLPLPSARRRRAVMADLDRVIMQLVAQRRALGANGSDLLSLLLSARDADTGEPMDDRQVRDEALTILLAGHETTANALSWALHLISQRPDVQDRLGQELTAVLDHRLPEVGDVPRLPYTAAVFNEAMRLYPPAWMMARHLMYDRTISGHDLPAGAMVLVSPYVVHRDPVLWPDPDAFDPERWLTPDPGRHRYSFVPFGAGPRQCIGNSFAELEGIVCLAAMARDWTFHPTTTEPIRTRPAITLSPRGGLPLRLRHR